jgi:hypothetical protein
VKGWRRVAGGSTTVEREISLVDGVGDWEISLVDGVGDWDGWSRLW